MSVHLSNLSIYTRIWTHRFCVYIAASVCICQKCTHLHAALTTPSHRPGVTTDYDMQPEMTGEGRPLSQCQPSSDSRYQCSCHSQWPPLSSPFFGLPSPSPRPPPMAKSAVLTALGLWPHLLCPPLSCRLVLALLLVEFILCCCNLVALGYVRSNNLLVIAI